MLHLSVISRINSRGFGPGRVGGAFPETGRTTLRVTPEWGRGLGREQNMDEREEMQIADQGEKVFSLHSKGEVIGVPG